jgi:hypothetical protein
MKNSEALVARLDHLERQNARLSAQVRRTTLMLRLAFLVAAGGLFWAVTLGQEVRAQARAAQVLRASGFVLVDKAGQERGSFSYNESEQNVVLNLESKSGARINLGVGDDHFGLRLTHDKSDIDMGYTKQGGTYLVLYDKEGKPFFEQRHK